MPKINQEEYEVLKGLDDKWKWIARDPDTVLWAYETKPGKFAHSFGWADSGLNCHSIYGDHFHFVRWEDESPYNIAELIEEYEKENESSFTIQDRLTPMLESLFEESEETEVKNIEELKSWFEDDKLYVGEYVKHKINQLDEPEVLSLDWIDDNKKYSGVHSIGYYVPIGKLHDLLVPKQEEVDRAYKDGYEKGKQHATKKQSEETETVASVLVDYLIASAKLKLALRMEVEELEE